MFRGGHRVLWVGVFCSLCLGVISSGRASGEVTTVNSYFQSSDFLVRNGSFNLFPDESGQFGMGIAIMDDGFPEILLGFSSGQWGIARNCFGPNGYQLTWMSDSLRSLIPGSNHALIGMFYNEMKSLGRDQLVMVFRETALVIDRESRQVIHQLDFDQTWYNCWIHDFDQDGDPDLIFGSSNYYPLVVKDLYTGELIFELDMRVKFLAFGQVDNDPQEEMVFTSEYLCGGTIVDLKTYEIQQVYYPDFGSYLHCEDIDDDGRDEVIWVHVSEDDNDSIKVLDAEINQLKYRAPLDMNTTSMDLVDTDGDGISEIVTVGSRIKSCNAASGDELWESKLLSGEATIGLCDDFDLDGRNELWWSSTAENPTTGFRVFDLGTQKMEWTGELTPPAFYVCAAADVDQKSGNEIIAIASGSYTYGEPNVAYIYDASTHQQINSHQFEHRNIVKRIYIDDLIPDRKGMEICLNYQSEPFQILDAVTFETCWESSVDIECAVPVDFNQDGTLEILGINNPSSTSDGFLAMFNASDGTEMWRSNMSIPQGHPCSMDLADIDGDGIIEVGVATSANSYIINGMSNELDWISEEIHSNNILFADLYPEIAGTEIIFDSGSRTISIYNGISHELITAFGLDWEYICALRSTDIDSDGNLELLALSRQALYVFDNKGNIIWNTEPITNHHASDPGDVICDDIDDDGVIDVLTAGLKSIWKFRYADAKPPDPSECLATGVNLELQDHDLNHRDPFRVTATLCNLSESNLKNHHIVVLLDVYGEFWSLPSWQNLDQGLDSYCYTIPSGAWTFNVVPLLLWPQTVGPVSNIGFWGAILDPQLTSIVGEYSHVEFGWR